MFIICVHCVSELFAFVNIVNNTPGMLYPRLIQMPHCLIQFNLTLIGKFL